MIDWTLILTALATLWICALALVWLLCRAAQHADRLEHGEPVVLPDPLAPSARPQLARTRTRPQAF